MIQIDTLRTLDNNPRKIDDAALTKLAESIHRDPEYMIARPLIVGADNVILGGNQRLKAIRSLGMSEIPDEWVRRVEWDADKARRFVLVDNAPTGMAGEWDVELLQAHWMDVDLDALGLELEKKEEDYSDDRYTKKIVPPIYTPKGECPPVYELFDDTPCSLLRQEIEVADIPDEVKDFLKKAAERHTSFHFRKIAEFYCHADQQVQDLMEKSGLVIIDFGKAIEYGFVHMTEKLGKLADLEESENDA